jgi:NAD(P)H-nitrite reductase large subunit
MSEKRYDYLILGNSTAAVAAVEAIRAVDAAGTVAVVSDQPQHVYSPPLITYVLGGKIAEDRLYTRARDFYAQLKVDTYFGVPATSLRPDEHQVVLASGAALGYGKLLLATGGTPVIPPLPGVDLQGVFTFTRHDDMVRVREYIRQHKVISAVVIGGGMIGVKVAEAFSALGLETTIVEMLDRVLAQALDEVGSAMAKRALEAHGLRVLTGSGVTSIGGSDGRVQSVSLDSGSRLPAQVVIVAVGVRPNVQLAHEGGLSVNRGVLVDEHMRTSAADVFAAGDVAEAYDPLIGEARPIAIWPAASLQGETAGMNMAGQDAAYDGSIPMNSIQVCGLPTISVGLNTPPEGAETLEYRSPDGKIYRRMFIVGDRIVGAIFIGDIERAGIITGLIRGAIDVSSFREKLIKRDLGLLSLPKHYRKHIVRGPGIEV